MSKASDRRATRAIDYAIASLQHPDQDNLQRRQDLIDAYQAADPYYAGRAAHDGDRAARTLAHADIADGALAAIRGALSNNTDQTIANLTQAREGFTK